MSLYPLTVYKTSYTWYAELLVPVSGIQGRSQDEAEGSIASSDIWPTQLWPELLKWKHCRIQRLMLPTGSGRVGEGNI